MRKAVISGREITMAWTRFMAVKDREKTDLRDISEAKIDKTWFYIGIGWKNSGRCEG